ncbi:hypothetical protein [Robertkochia sediminum]|uniref:hypothetical protein n=1 Tax=Robertkochia sediminum TaxID=2785326 RepID=UPI001F30A6AF|nr:hypothetical protein [Robertkochia sediminum]MBL7473359.1 hypothetical protein [Robertkochia sediminum]
MNISKRLYFMAGGILFILLIPFVAMQFTTEVQWSSADFLVMGSLLLFLVIGLETILRLVRGKGTRTLLITTLLLVFLLVWAELAVGVFNTPFAGS